MPRESQPSSALLIGLDTVMRLAEEQNAQVGIARARLDEACALRNVADKKWLPEIWGGVAFYRHEGGIQNEDGTLTHSSSGAMFSGMEMDGRWDVREIAYQQVNAQRQVWQQKGELSRVTSETMLDASTTYIDLLTARTGEQVAADILARLNNLLDRAQRLASTEPAARVQVARIQAEVDAERQAAAKLRLQAAAAAAKLIYLLGLDAAAQLVPLDSHLIAFDLVDATATTPYLVIQALLHGPGIAEMEGLLSLIQQSIEKSQGAGQYMPVFELRMGEGGFGAGANDNMNWGNRWELGLQARWNLTEFLTQRDRRRAAQAKVRQAQLAYQDLRGKLTAGVQEAKETIESGREQIRLTENQVQSASEAYDLSYTRLREAFQSTSYTEALLALQALGRAQASLLMTMNAYDKAQLRLLVLLGPAACIPPTHTAAR